jgi:hypothetical protein
VFLWHVKLALLLETRACVALTQGLEGHPMLGELLRDTLLGLWIFGEVLEDVTLLDATGSRHRTQPAHAGVGCHCTTVDSLEPLLT